MNINRSALLLVVLKIRLLLLVVQTEADELIMKHEFVGIL